MNKAVKAKKFANHKKGKIPHFVKAKHYYKKAYSGLPDEVLKSIPPMCSIDKKYEMTTFGMYFQSTLDAEAAALAEMQRRGIQ